MSNNNRYSLRVQVVNNFFPRPEDYVTAYWQGENFVDVRYNLRKPKITIRRISKTKYKVLYTGEIKEYKPMTEDDKIKSRKVALSRTMQELRMLIRTNFTAESKNQLFITLTYAQEGKEKPDEKQLYNDFKKFMKRLRYAYPENEYEYIVVFEPQGNTWFHSHLMIKCVNKPYWSVKNSEIERIWSHGWTSTKRLKSSDVGAYYVAYFTDLIDETKLSENSMTANEKTKARQKGSRLSLYPKNFRFYRCSRGIMRPTKEELLHYHFDHEQKDYEKVYEKAYEVKSLDNDYGEESVINKVYKATYKRKGK